MKKRKLKVNKQFVPCPVSENDEIYANGIFMFNISKMLEYINATLNDFPIEYVPVVFWANNFSSIDESHLDSVDIAKPVIIAEIGPDRYNVIDGNHRIEKAQRMGQKKLPAHRLTVRHHINFLIDKEAYLSYVEYWNSKII